jgi:hypothetical protein
LDTLQSGLECCAARIVELLFEFLVGRDRSSRRAFVDAALLGGRSRSLVSETMTPEKPRERAMTTSKAAWSAARRRNRSEAD